MIESTNFNCFDTKITSEKCINGVRLFNCQSCIGCVRCTHCFECINCERCFGCYNCRYIIGGICISNYCIYKSGAYDSINSKFSEGKLRKIYETFNPNTPIRNKASIIGFLVCREDCVRKLISMGCSESIFPKEVVGKLWWKN